MRINIEKMLRQADTEVQRLRDAGWTREDFIEVLRKELGHNRDILADFAEPGDEPAAKAHGMHGALQKA